MARSLRAAGVKSGSVVDLPVTTTPLSSTKKHRVRLCNGLLVGELSSCTMDSPTFMNQVDLIILVWFGVGGIVIVREVGFVGLVFVGVGYL